ncbi:hypothetical protein RFI_22596 [Reticulomyxa filosa]|uniref:Uncharacterized protein n=1 Tax=Reticulomyxa filosa TaxID=46433 RepID=X6MMV6_RETFI|nr:hypothetical protein RFI_22596 [Reticulomyxa filosa]|eukprot:ETO14772.1 hypothetical protein RFI_22596 [Reticulomyxa filosa]
MHGGSVDWPKNHKVLFLLVSTYIHSQFNIQKKKWGPKKKKKKTSCQIGWKSSSTRMTPTKKELDRITRIGKTRISKEWDELSEYYKNENKKEAKEAIAVITENEKPQPQQTIHAFVDDTYLTQKKKDCFVTYTKYWIILYFFFLVGGKIKDKVQFHKP